MLHSHPYIYPLTFKFNTASVCTYSSYQQKIKVSQNWSFTAMKLVPLQLISYFNMVSKVLTFD